MFKQLSGTEMGARLHACGKSPFPTKETQNYGNNSYVIGLMYARCCHKQFAGSMLLVLISRGQHCVSIPRSMSKGSDKRSFTRVSPWAVKGRVMSSAKGTGDEL